MQGDSLTVVALCAAWCGTCREFRPVFDALVREMPHARFVWVDIEDEPEVAGDLEIETFPTLGVMHGAVPVHFGPTTPQKAVVERLLRGLVAGAVVPEEAAGVLRRALEIGSRPTPG
jgi:thioredoxin-like negative regulator of GroEL